jgi:hypothetical protein
MKQKPPFMKAIQLLLSLRVIPCFAGRTPPQPRHPHTCQETKPCPGRQNLCQKLGMNERHGVLKDLRAKNQVECLGRGQNAQWRKTSKWELGNTQ